MEEFELPGAISDERRKRKGRQAFHGEEAESPGEKDHPGWSAILRWDFVEPKYVKGTF